MGDHPESMMIELGEMSILVVLELLRMPIEGHSTIAHLTALIGLGCLVLVVHEQRTD
jgi:hypothetical protein